MNLTLRVPLQPRPEGTAAPRATTERFHAPGNALVAVAFRERAASEIRLQKQVGQAIRRGLGPSSRSTVGAVGKAVEA